MMMEFLLLEKDLWEITLGEHCQQKLNLETLFLKETLLNTSCSWKKKKAHGVMLLNVVDYLLHHVAHVKIAKDAWDNLCATF
jgi:hypothetical protein